MSDRGPWTQTHMGKRFYPLDPRVEDIELFDIAWSLSMQCRFAGHTSRFYSVAEHSIYVSDFCSPKNKLAGLLHDATEAYLTDIPSPIKSLIPKFTELQDKLYKVIAEKFKLPQEIPEEVHLIDKKIVHDEAIKLLIPLSPSWVKPSEKLGVKFFTSPKDHLFYFNTFIKRAQDLGVSYFG